MYPKIGRVSATLLQFAQVMDEAAATPKRLAKQARLGAYFASIDADDDLRRAVRFAGGQAFPSTDERTPGASGAIAWAAVLATWPLDAGTLRAESIRAGEMGEAVATLVAPLLPGGAPAGAGGGGLTLADLSRAFEALAATGSQDGKRRILINLFSAVRHPREAVYALKILFSDLRTGVKEGVLQAAVAEAFGTTTAAVQQAQFLIGNLDDVAVLARHGRLGEARFTLFHPIQFMLATPKETSEDLAAAFDGRTFWAEDKLDGIRAQIHKDDAGRVAIYSRTMDRIDESFPELVAGARRIDGSFLFDGEVVACRNGATAAFAHLQPRLGRKRLSAKVLRENPVAFVVFDALYRDGELLLDRPLRDRRGRIGLPAGDAVCDGAFALLRPTEVRTAAEIDAAFAAARDRDNEGLVLKDPESAYTPGRRGQVWFKLKTHLPTLDCVVTAAEYGHGKRRGVLSDYTFAVWDGDPVADDAARLVNIGKAYSGLTDAEIATLTERFRQLAFADNGRVFQVRPEVVLEIAMDQIQRSERHASGFALRFPRIKRIRDDKRPEDADRLERVREIFASKANITKKDVPQNVAGGAKIEEPGLFDGIPLPSSQPPGGAG